MIFILSKYPFLNIGHYWSFDGYLRNALRDCGEPYVFINPSADRARKEDLVDEKSQFKYVKSIDGELFIEDSIRLIKEEIYKSQTKQVILIIPWLPQFSIGELQKLVVIDSLVDTAYLGLSTSSASQIQGKSVDGFRYLHEEYFEKKANKVLWVSNFVKEEYPNRPFIREIPDFAENSASRVAKPKFDISFFGLLTPYRGLFEVLIIGLFNPKLHIRIKGYGFARHRIYRPWRMKILRYQSLRTNPLLSIFFSGVSVMVSFLRVLPNIDFSPVPFASEEDLDLAMSETRTIFYCAKLPHGSGLTNKSLAAGIPILWTGWEGQAFRVLNKYYPVGYFRYFEIFIPGRFSKKVACLPEIAGIREQMWKEFRNEISTVIQVLSNK